MRSRSSVTLAEKPREMALALGGSMMPYRWSINEQLYPKSDPIVLEKGEPVRFHFRKPLHFLDIQVLNWVQLVLATPVVLWCGWPFFERA
jgi:hypothetical protein